MLFKYLLCRPSSGTLESTQLGVHLEMKERIENKTESVFEIQYQESFACHPVVVFALVPGLLSLKREPGIFIREKARSFTKLLALLQLSFITEDTDACFKNNLSYRHV